MTTATRAHDQGGGYEAKEDENMNPGFNGVGRGSSRRSESRGSGARHHGSRSTLGPKVAVVTRRSPALFGDRTPSAGTSLRQQVGKEGEIVGVVRDGKGPRCVRSRCASSTPLQQETDVGEMTFYVRSALAPGPSRLGCDGRPGRRRDAAVTKLKTMRVQVNESLFVERMVAAYQRRSGSWPRSSPRWALRRDELCGVAPDREIGIGWPWARSGEPCC